MLTSTEEKWLDYIEKRARHNIKGRSFFRVTDILEDAFCLSEDKSYEVLKNIMARKTIGNSPESVISEYMSMLEKGYGSIKEQMEIMGGDKLSYVKSTSEIRAKNFEGGTLLDAVREIYNVSEEDLLPLLTKFLDSIESKEFTYTFDKKAFDKFLEDDMDELNAQAERYEH